MWLIHLVVRQNLTQHCTLSSNFLKKIFILTSHFSLLLRSLLSCLSSLRHYWWKRDYIFLSNTWVSNCSLHVLKKKKIKGISSLEKDGLTHISREDFPIDLHVEKACLLVEKHEAVSYWSLILSSPLRKMTPRRGVVRWPIGWGADQEEGEGTTQGRFKICPLLPTKQFGDRTLPSATQVLCGMKA